MVPRLPVRGKVVKDVDEMSPAERARYYADCIRGAAEDSAGIEAVAFEMASVLAEIVRMYDLPACGVYRVQEVIARYNAVRGVES